MSVFDITDVVLLAVVRGLSKNGTPHDPTCCNFRIFQWENDGHDKPRDEMGCPIFECPGYNCEVRSAIPAGY